MDGILLNIFHDSLLRFEELMPAPKITLKQAAFTQSAVAAQQTHQHHHMAFYFLSYKNATGTFGSSSLTFY